MELELYLLGFLGVLLHLLKKIYEARKKKIILDNILETISTVISLLIVCVLVYSKSDLETLYPLVPLTAVFLGYGAQSIFRFLVNAKTPKDMNINN